jgi:hypothetical protein
MKKILSLLMGMVCLVGMASAAETEKQDTLFIKFGNNSQVMIVVEDEDDLAKIQRYDLNKMLSDMQIMVETETGEKQLVITDQTGKRYLKDTTVIVSGKSSAVDESVAEHNSQYNFDDGESDTSSSEYNFNFNKSSKKKRFDRYNHTLNFELGLNNYLNADNQFPDTDNAWYAVRPIVSWTYAINSVNQSRVAKWLRLDYGLGLQWYNFSLEDNSLQIVKGDEAIDFVERDDVSGYKRSKLNITYLNFNFVPVFTLGGGSGHNKDFFEPFENKGGFRIGVGGYAGYRIGAKSKFRYDDEKNKIKTNFHLNNWRYGVKAQIGWRGIDLFATYDLNELFIENRGPALNAFSFGIII